MKNRIALLVLGFIGLFWIAFISVDLLKTDTSNNFLTYFNKKDVKIIVIHNWFEIDRNTDNIVLPPSNETVINSLASKALSASFYISTTRPIIVIERKDRWNKSNVENLFKNGIFPFKRKNNRSFTFGKYSGEYLNNQLILFACDIENQSGKIFKVDRKASFSEVNFLSSGFEIKDVFKKQNSTYIYKKNYIGKNLGLKHDDKKMFASVLPDKFSSYSFFDKEYLASTDPTFKKSPFKKWINEGIVILRSGNKSLGIFDFKDGQNPIQNLNELINKSELNEEFASYLNVRFSSLINEASKKELFVAESEGFCLVSYSKDLIDEVLTEIKLGNSLSKNEQKLNEVYGNLPAKVTARFVDSINTKAISVIGRCAYEVTFKKTDSPIEKEAKKDREYFAMNPGEKVLDFATFNERGNVALITENNNIIGYINGLKKWQKPIKGEIMLKSYLSNRKYVCLFVNNECQVLDMYGKINFRFTSVQGICPEQYELKSKTEFLVANSSNNFSILNDQGTFIKQFSCAGTIKEIAIHKGNNGRPVAVVLTNSMLYTLDLTKRKTTIKVALDSLYQLGKDQNGIYAISHSNGALNVINMSGIKTTVSIGNFNDKPKIFSSNSGISILFKKQKSLYCFDLKGKRKWMQNFSLNEITESYFYENEMGKIQLIILDGIENELYLLNQNGKLMDVSSKHGEQKVDISGFGSRGFSITTYLGNYLIQYNK
jgi:hypothetical protein